MRKIALPAALQRKLIEDYVRSKDLDWNQAAKEFGVGYSTLRYSYRTGRLCIPLYILKKLLTDKGTLVAILEKYEVYNVVDKAKIPNNSNSKKAKVSLIQRYGDGIFIKLAKKGAAVTNKMWTEKRRIKQSDVGKRGGLKRIENAVFLTEQERLLADENKKLGLEFKTNCFLSPSMNFDFVYFRNNKPIAIEEVTLSPFRGFTYFLEKRKFLDKEYGKTFPFLLTIGKTRNYEPLITLLNKYRITVINSLQDRYKVFNTNFIFKPKIKFTHRQTKAAETELRRPMSLHENIVNAALKDLGLKPKGKSLLREGNLSIVTDNSFVLSGEKVNVLVSYAKSRGSLFYQLYKNATYGFLIRAIFKEKVFVVIFDFTKTVSALSSNLPRKLCIKNCNFYAITFKSDIGSLKMALQNALGR